MRAEIGNELQRWLTGGNETGSRMKSLDGAGRQAEFQNEILGSKLGKSF